MKLLADRKQGHRFLLLGSCQILSLQKVRETAAGRATLLKLWPLALVERSEGPSVPPPGLDLLWQEGEAALAKLESLPISTDEMRRRRARAEDHRRWGGHPALEPLPEDDRKVSLRDFRRTYLERDLADLGRVADLDQFALAQNLRAVRTAQLLSYSEVARELGVAVNTDGDQAEGALFETAALAELVRWRSWQADPPALHFYRTRAGREIDFVLHAGSRLLALEAKASERAHPTDARPLVDFLGTKRPGAAAAPGRLGLVVTRGREIERLAARVWAIPDWRLFGLAT